jgi:hypothetical protein
MLLGVAVGEFGLTAITVVGGLFGGRETNVAVGFLSSEAEPQT